MTDPVDPKRTVEELTKIFEDLGATDAESWARSQVEEGFNQLARYSFLKAAWDGVISEDDDQWIDSAISQFEERPDSEGAGAGRALKRLLALGANRRDLTDLVWSMQTDTLWEICATIDNCGAPYEDPANPDLYWQLNIVGVRDEGNTGPDVCGLHESVLETDPTGRELGPRPEK